MQSKTDLDRVETLARQLGATVHWTVDPNHNGGPDGPRANTPERAVWAIPLSASPESFWSTMHELGHIANNHLGTDPFEKMLFGAPNEPEQEAQAWAWAIDNAGRPLDKYARASIQYSLASYLYVNEPFVNVGPNLKRIFALVGPTVDQAAVAQVFHSPKMQSHIPQVAAVWQEYAGTIELAA